MKTTTVMDVVGHTIETQITSDPINTVYADTTYDGLGRVATKSNPYRTTGDATYGFTYYQYDALGRTLKVTTPDSSVATTSYYGPTATVTDQAGHVRTLTSDPLNRLVSVTEDPGTGHFNYVTNYTYDALDGLIGVNQNNSGVVRTFYYDSLKRLLAATNPENASASYPANQTCTGAPKGTVWATCYTYDNAGNLTIKTDNRPITTTNSYDALNRISTKTYSDSTPPVTYTYDATATNSIGHLTSVSNSNSTTNYTSFDPMGRVTASTQVTGGQSYSFTYAYNLAGSLKTESYPSGRVATTVYDNTNHATSLTGALAGNNTNYVSGVTYWPHGAEWLLTYGNNVVPVYSYNNRLQTSQIYATVGNSPNNYLSVLNYNWGTTNNNGNLQSSSEGYGTSVPYASLSWLSQNYSYDAVNRVTSVSDTGYSRTFGYDAYGNAWVKTNSGVPQAGNTPTSNVFKANNQIFGGSYDAAGNQTGVNGDTAAYDAESRQISLTEPASLDSGVENYLYDGNGQRVEKTGPDGAMIYVYDAAGRVAAEYGTSALASPCTTCYMVTDHLGTARLVTDAGANIIARHDYLPFGEEIAGGTAGRSSVWGPEADTVSRKFTGKERDAESGLDYFGARYYGSALGRFTSPDWAESPEPVPYANLRDPQTLNLYAYGRNSPLSATDLDGHCTSGGEQKGFWWCLFNISDQDGENARTALSQMHGFTLNGQTPGGFAAQASNEQAVRARRQVDQWLAGVALSPCPQGVSCGILVPFSVDEAAIASELESEGATVERLETIEGQKNPDALVNGAVTEFKTVTTAGTNTLKNQIQDGLKQAPNVVIDVRKTAISRAEALQQIQRVEGKVGSLQGKVTVITNEGILRH